MSPSAAEDVNTELNNADFLDIVEVTRVLHLSFAQWSVRRHRYDVLDIFIIDIYSS